MTISSFTLLPEEAFSTSQREDTSGLLCDRFTDAAGAEVLPAEVIYHNYVERLPAAHLTQEQENALLAKARAGLRPARDALLASCQRYIRYLASQYARLHFAQQGDRRVEFLDLVQEANAAFLTNFEQALTKYNPCAYLRVVVRHAIIRWCISKASIVHNPDRTFVRIPVQSLDRPLTGDNDSGKTMLADLIAAPSPIPPSPLQDYPALAQMIERLTPAQQEVILRHYGWGGHPAEALSDISPQARYHHLNALRRLRQLLSTPQEALTPVEGLRPRDQVYNWKQVCHLLQISPSSLYKLVRQGVLTRCETGYYAKEEVDALAKAHPLPSPEERYTAQQARRLLHVTQTTLTSWVRRGLLTRCGTGSYRKQEVDALAQARTPASTQEGYSSRQACTILGVDRSTLCRFVQRGWLSHSMAGFYRKDEVERLAAERAHIQQLKPSA